jgi:hypothetical protein
MTQLTDAEILTLAKTPSLPCTSCKGTGTYVSPAWSYEGTDYPERTTKCYGCDGRGSFTCPDTAAIVKLLSGKSKGGLRSAKPKQDTEAGKRAAYVWRFARFHGGADVTMPCTVDAQGDPYKVLLDLMADAVASRAFGTNMAAAYRWGRALGFTNKATPEGLPASAYEGGPEHDWKDQDTITMLRLSKKET